MMPYRLGNEKMILVDQKAANSAPAYPIRLIEYHLMSNQASPVSPAAHLKDRDGEQTDCRSARLVVSDYFVLHANR